VIEVLFTKIIYILKMRNLEYIQILLIIFIFILEFLMIIK